ncbi:hypothetical protein KKH39_01550 [Patescibacteria group bacterium]|nr:hypothetical protein [Patescibacteria group bacterium]
MKIANIPIKKILKWVSKTPDAGFNFQDLQNGLNVSSSDAQKIYYEFLKANGYINNSGSNPALYIKTSKVMSDLNAMKTWFERPVGLIIIGVIIVIIAMVFTSQWPSILKLISEWGI